MNHRDLTTRTDDQLARDARAGSVACFEELVRRYQVPLLRFLQRRCPGRSEAEDLLQESFLRAYRSLDKYADGRSFKAWLFTLTYRLAVSEARKRRVRTAGELPEVVEGKNEQPVTTLGQNESQTRMWEKVRTIVGEEVSTVLWLFYVEEMPAAEIAKVVGHSWVWVKTALHRARVKLREPLTQEWENEVMR